MGEEPVTSLCRLNGARRLGREQASSTASPGPPRLSVWHTPLRARGRACRTPGHPARPQLPSHLQQPREHLSIAPGAHRRGPGLAAGLCPQLAAPGLGGDGARFPPLAGPEVRAREWRVGPQTSCNPEAPGCPQPPEGGAQRGV